MSKITVQKIKNLNTLVIKQQEGRFFISTDDSIIISIDSFSFLLKFLVQSGYLSKKVLESILQEVNDAD